MPKGRDLSLKKWEQRVNEKIRKQRQVADLDDRLTSTIRIQRQQNQAFRDTIDNVESDFRKLKQRVEKLEKEINANP
jgi:ubiquinone biosynthesis protein UbiJ